MIVGSRVLRFSACLVLLGLVACDKGPSAPSSQAKPAWDDFQARVDDGFQRLEKRVDDLLP